MSKIYTNQIISDTPLNKELNLLSYNTQKTDSRNIYRPKVILDQPFPFKSTADEVHGSTTNTLAGTTYRTFSY
jgi:hypothetical protein